MILKPFCRAPDHTLSELIRGLLRAHDLFQDEQAILLVDLREQAHWSMPAEVPCPEDHPMVVDLALSAMEVLTELREDTRPGANEEVDLHFLLPDIGVRVGGTLLGEPLLRVGCNLGVGVLRVLERVSRIMYPYADSIHYGIADLDALHAAPCSTGCPKNSSAN